MRIRRDRRSVRFVVVCVVAVGCAGNKADTTAANAIGTVRVTTNIASVRDCRIIRHVDSRDAALGCGAMVQPTLEECLRYQVRSVGGDTLLMRGPAGEAYDCGRAESPTIDQPPTTPAAGDKASAHAPLAPAPRNPATATPIPEPSVAPAAAAVPESTASVPATTDRSSARGCVYLGDLSWTAACGESPGAAAGPCAEQTRRLGGNLVVRENSRAEVFWCRPTP